MTQSLRSRLTRFGVIISAALVTGGILAAPTAAQAEPPYKTEGSITSIKFVNTETKTGQEQKLTGTWKIEDNPKPQAGFSVALPEDLVGLTDSFPLRDDAGKAMGECKVEKARFYCDIDPKYTEERPLDISGTFELWVRVETKVDREQTVNYDFNGLEAGIKVKPQAGRCAENCDFQGIKNNKYGWYNRETNEINWVVQVGAGSEGLKAGQKVTVVDSLGENQSFTDAPRVRKTNQVHENARGQSVLNWGNEWVDNPTISPDKGTVSWTAEEGYFYQVRWTVKVDDAGAADLYENNAAITVGGETKNVSRAINRNAGSATGNGRALEVKEGKFLAYKVLRGNGVSRLHADSTFTLNYSYPAGDGYKAGKGSIELPADGETISSPKLPAGAYVTFTEAKPDDVKGAKWERPKLSTDRVDTKEGKVLRVKVVNTLTRTAVAPDSTEESDDTKDASAGGSTNLPQVGSTVGAGWLAGAGLLIFAGAATLLMRRRVTSS